VIGSSKLSLRFFPEKNCERIIAMMDRRLLTAVHRLNSPSGQLIVHCMCARSQFRSAHVAAIDCL
jgi:hypothetical protein